ncbi:nuclear body protein SP140-like protein isoform X2 [Salarias fasciatus]|uniref:nuclear body protein SP140-like protein isoform X2 n=1 Tax=Salarias fasciatus TaxID=181472 RepID=UPI001176B388|nr:nuclear body protein SP140-like protein isoform X2 [Salarias fasciatus]
MNPPDLLDFIVDKELLQTFHCKKNEISCMENPQTFLRQLRDYNFVPEDRYEKVSRMKSKEKMKKSIYEILDWVEENRSKDIRRFWKCVFMDVIVNHYPTMKMLHRSFLDGSYRSGTQSPEAGDTSERSPSSENEKKKTKLVKKKRKRKIIEDEEQEEAGPSSQVTPRKKKKTNKIIYTSPLKRGEKSEIWTWPIFRTQLPVTCFDKKGILHREKLAQGERCILAEKRWLTPNEFQRLAGKFDRRSWKATIRCEGETMEKLIKEGHIKFKRCKITTDKSKPSPTIKEPSLSFRKLVTDSEEEEEEEKEETAEEASSEAEEAEPSPDRLSDGSQKVFSVTCGSLTGKLHKERFATGFCGKSIRTETSWMTPKDFATAGSGQTEALWKRDIQWEGKPLNDLIMNKMLHIHSVNCDCKCCKPEENELVDQENDDECWACKSENGEVLVPCDFCPRAFHQNCHLPHVEDSQLGDERQWKCTFCMFESSQDRRAPVDRNTVMSYQMPQHTQECHYLVLSLRNADEKRAFAADPRLHLKNYSSFVTNPMWLCKVADKLQKQEYQTVGQFVSDVQLIFTNCATYHTSDEDVRAMGEKLKQLFEKQFMTAFNVNE